ncbi:acyl-CoA thioesterase [Alteromonas stellipolaris]|jgi:acyl-CoA thioester hydrolase|uniref:acyl-CoA thioesterase n=1 Tax=Alteromonas stellipolaris TaxID=233316 RepID=UPI001D8CD2A6|nr:thioesterase family protein [Alteromonas stellipolaris]MBZ2163751.1 acyl-CoA thioesterase [Alteromonas stellipolaris]
MAAASLPWRYPSPFTKLWQIDASHLDHYNHVNNVAYLSQAEALAWSHSNSLGLQFSDYQSLNRAMVIKRHELDYHLPSHEGDSLQCATWIVSCDNRLTLKRQFQFVCERRNKTVFEALTTFVCVSLDTGAPKRLPEPFKEVYGNACIEPSL